MKITLRSLVSVSVYVAQTTLAVVPFNDTRLGSVGSECGILGVMKLPEVLPAGIDLGPAKIHKCAEHPLQLIPSELRDEMESTVATIEAGSSLTKRACEFGAPFGCSKTDFAGKFVTAPEDGAGPPRTVELVLGKLVKVSMIATSAWRVGSGMQGLRV